MVNFVIEEYNTSQQLELCDHCHRIEAASQQEGTWVYRLYSDYAEHGDLRGLINIYYQEANRDKQIPEQFIWMVFHALADALCTMNTGQCGEALDEEKAAKERQEVQEIEKEGPNTKTKTKKQKQGAKKARKRFKGGMVHLDVKPENIFLNTGKAPHLAYPKPFLADYDVVKMIAPQTDTMESRKDWGTKGFQAPEIITEAAHHHSVNAKTDIWSLGMVIWKMMHTTLGREKSVEICEDSIKASFQFADGNTFTSTDIPDYDAMYSNTLHQLVIDCLQINPEKRPNHDALRKKAKAEFERLQRRLGPVLTETKNGSDIASHLRVLRGEELDFKLGEKFQEPRRKRRKTATAVDEDVNV
jgi:serine/threonine protein kinase